MGHTVKEYSQMIGFLTRDKTSTVPRPMVQETLTMDQGGRMGYLTGGQVKNENAWIKANPNTKFDDLTPTLKYSIRKTGRTELGTMGSGAKAGKDNPLYTPLSKNGEKIAMKVYGTLDITDGQRQDINSGRITMDTKAVKFKKGEDISLNMKRGSEEVTGVKWPSKETEKEFIKAIKQRVKQPEKAVVDFTNEALAENFNISEKQAGRLARYIIKKEGLKYAVATETSAADRIKQRNKELEPIDSKKQKDVS